MFPLMFVCPPTRSLNDTRARSIDPAVQIWNYYYSCDFFLSLTARLNDDDCGLKCSVHRRRADTADIYKELCNLDVC